MRTTVDWAGFRTQAEIPVVRDAIRQVFYPMDELVAFRNRKSGWNGFEQAVDILMGDMVLGFMAYGGDAQRGWVSVNITGRGCEWCRDWDRAEGLLVGLLRFEWRRVDIALTVKNGSITHERVVAAHTAGMFSLGGRPPVMREITHSDPLVGRTAYIGARTAAKFLRCYEKGLEMLKDVPSSFKDMYTHVDGAPVQDIYRVELEWKAKDASLPLDAVTRRDAYFAGAYPFTASLIDAVPELYVQRREKGPQRDLEIALMQIRHQYGKTIYTAIQALGGDISALVDKVTGTAHNEALLAAGVLLVEHD